MLTSCLCSTIKIKPGKGSFEEHTNVPGNVTRQGDGGAPHIQTGDNATSGADDTEVDETALLLDSGKKKP